MPKAVLTDLLIRNLKSDQQTDFWDSHLPSFLVRVGKRRKTFQVVTGTKAGRRRISLGHYPAVSLQEARMKAIVTLTTVGQDEVTAINYEDALEFFLNDKRKNNKASSAREIERLLRRHFPFKGMLSTITAARVLMIVGQLKRSEANHSYVAIRTFFNWCVSKRYLARSPLEGTKLPYKHRSRDRALTDPELSAVLKEINEPKTRYDVLIGLLITTGQRCNEIGSLRPEFIDAGARTITLPAWLTKNNTQHTFPYGPRTAALLEQYEFADKAFDSWGTIKRLFDKRVKLPHYTWHDFRRTLSTIMARENLAPITSVEALLNHKTGSRSPIQRIYDRHDYMPQMREAVLAYETYISRLISGSETP